MENTFFGVGLFAPIPLDQDLSHIVISDQDVSDLEFSDKGVSHPAFLNTYVLQVDISTLDVSHHTLNQDVTLLEISDLDVSHFHYKVISLYIS